MEYFIKCGSAEVPRTCGRGEHPHSSASGKMLPIFSRLNAITPSASGDSREIQFPVLFRRNLTDLPMEQIGGLQINGTCTVSYDELADYPQTEQSGGQGNIVNRRFPWLCGFLLACQAITQEYTYV